MNLNKNKDKIKEVLAYLSTKIKKYRTAVVTFLLVIMVFDYFLFPLPALAQAEAIGPEVLVSGELADNDERLSAPEPDLILTQDDNEEDPGNADALAAADQGESEPVKPNANLPKNPDAKPKKIKTVEITAYNSDVAQCDASPCITANGFNVCKHGIEDTIATNALPFGTKVRIPDLFGDRIFIVRDRMNSRYHDRVDVWMLDHKKAIKFGIKYAKIEILP